MPKNQQLVTGLVLVLVSALANALAFPPWGLRPLAFVSLAPLFVAIRGGGLMRAILLGALWGEIWSWSIASAFPASIATFYGRSMLFGIVVGSLIFFVMSALYYAVFAALDRVVVRRPRVFTPLLVAAAWVVVELGRGRLFTGSAFFIGNPWGLQGYTHSSGALAQIASAAGVYGIGFTLVAVNAGLAGLICAWSDREARRTALRAMGLALLPVALSWIYGAMQLGNAPAPEAGSGLREIAVVQGNVSIDRRWRSDFHAKNLGVYLKLTHEALRTGQPSLIVWPETSLNFFVEAEPSYRHAITSVLRAGPASLLVGGPSGDGDKLPPYYNSVFLIDPLQGVEQRYDKEYLVPFSEYFPAASFDWMRRRIDGARTFEPGPATPAPLETPIGRVGVLICNEAMLPEVARHRVRAGAEVLVSPSNDSWVTGHAFGEHMVAVVALRAVEQRRFLVRASTAGPSSIVDPWGRITARTDAATAAVMRGVVRPERAWTLYARFGDTFAAGCVIVVALEALAFPIGNWLRRGPLRRRRT
jgi:apolipoprotein N-acyltransferase